MADGDPAAVQAAGPRRDQRVAALLRHRASSTSIPALRARRSSARADRLGAIDVDRVGPVVRWARGSAATATATRSSPPTCCASPSPARPTSRSATTCGRCSALVGASCRCRRASITPTPALLGLAEASGDDSPFRADEPYRRALRGMHARLHALRRRSCSTTVPGPPPHAALPARTRSLDELIADLDVVIDSLRVARCRRARRRVGRRRCGAPSPCSARHLCGLDLRQNSDVHELVVAELLAVAGVDGRLPARSTRPSGSTLLAARAGSARGRCARPGRRYGELTSSRAGRARRGGRGRRAATARGSSRTTSSRRPSR